MKGERPAAGDERIVGPEDFEAAFEVKRRATPSGTTMSPS